MCEFNAAKDNQSVFVNPSHKPEVNLTSKTNRTDFNLYYLDTIQKRWINKGKDIVSQARDKKSEISDYKTIDKPLPPAPVKPMKADGKRQTFSIEIDPNSVQELQVYNNLKFEVDESDKTFNTQAASEDWYDVKINKTATANVYLLSFSQSNNRKFDVLARPVFEGKDYDEAVKIFDVKQMVYNDLLADRLKKEKEEAERIKKANEVNGINFAMSQKQNEKMKKINEMIASRNKEIEQRNVQIKMEYETKVAAVKAKTEEIKSLVNNSFDEAEAKWRRNPEYEKARKEYDEQQAKIVKDRYVTSNIIRSFTFDGFGTWNCDHPQFPNKEKNILAKFTDQDGKELTLTNPVVVYKGMNGITQYYSNSIRILPDADNMIWATMDGKFAYLTYDDFKACSISPNTSQYTFKIMWFGIRIFYICTVLWYLTNNVRCIYTSCK
jgi:hypothetical protein